MKHECNVARDLMPLVLDDAASEESNQLLTEHLEECDACREYFGGMKAALPIAAKANSEQEQKAFDTAAHKARKKRRRRIWRNVLIGVLIGALVAVGAYWTWGQLTQSLNTLVYHGQYDVHLSQLDNGRVSVNMDYRGSSRYMMNRLDWVEEDGEQIPYVYNMTTRIPYDLSTPNGNYSCIRLSAGDINHLAEIRTGVPDEYAIVWQAGDDIPAASEAMESYYAIDDQISAIYSARTNPDSMMYTISYEDSQQLEELKKQAGQVYVTVPEWQ